MIYLVTSYRSVQSVDCFTLFNLEGTERYVPGSEEVDMGQQLSWLEHTTDNREVDGSSPFWPTTSKKGKDEIWGFSSAGRAPALQAGGQRFDPANLHHFKELIEAARD